MLGIGQGQNLVFMQTADGRLADETVNRIPIRARFAHDNDGADIGGDGTLADEALDWLPDLEVQRSTLPANHAIDSGDMFLRDFNYDGFPELLLSRGRMFLRLFLNSGKQSVNTTDFLPFS
jgi:hypothetical protein